jgi:hypothetical protein
LYLADLYFLLSICHNIGTYWSFNKHNLAIRGQERPMEEGIKVGRKGGERGGENKREGGRN